MKQVEEKLKNPKNFKVVSIKTSYIKLEEEFDIVLKEVEDIIKIYTQFYSSYDISKSIDDKSMSPIIHIIFYP